jgi:hypothetical protein
MQHKTHTSNSNSNSLLSIASFSFTPLGPWYQYQLRLADDLWVAAAGGAAWKAPRTRKWENHSAEPILSHHSAKADWKMGKGKGKGKGNHIPDGNDKKAKVTGKDKKKKSPSTVKYGKQRMAQFVSNKNTYSNKTTGITHFQIINAIHPPSAPLLAQLHACTSYMDGAPIYHLPGSSYVGCQSPPAPFIYPMLPLVGNYGYHPTHLSRYFPVRSPNFEQEEALRLSHGLPSQQTNHDQDSKVSARVTHKGSTALGSLPPCSEVQTAGRIDQAERTRQLDASPPFVCGQYSSVVAGAVRSEDQTASKVDQAERTRQLDASPPLVCRQSSRIRAGAVRETSPPPPPPGVDDWDEKWSSEFVNGKKWNIYFVEKSWARGVVMHLWKW